MFKILDWYIGRTIIATTILVLTTFIGLSGIIKYVEQLRKVGNGTYDLMQALLFVVLSIPRDIEMFFPMAALLGALIGLGALAASSELVVMQAAGFSKLDIGLSVLKTAVPLMIIITLLGEWGAPQAQKAARDLRAFATSGGQILSVRTGVWARMPTILSSSVRLMTTICTVSTCGVSTNRNNCARLFLPSRWITSVRMSG